jgi:hypothetical protein
MVAASPLYVHQHVEELLGTFCGEGQPGRHRLTAETIRWAENVELDVSAARRVPPDWWGQV